MITHSSKLERWLGREQIEEISDSMKNWYGPPIAIANVSGNVWVHKGGEFSGPIKAGQFCNLIDFTISRLKRILRNTYKRHLDPTLLHAGFSSLSDLISEATTGGKKYTFTFQKAGATGVVAVTSSLWGLGCKN